MTITNLTLLGTTTVGTPSGNYDGSTQDFYGDPQKAVNYYQGQGSLQTVFIRVSDFTGNMKIEATLNDDPDFAQWFEVYDYGDGSSVVTDYHPVNITGNFTFLRVHVTAFEAGTVNSVLLSY